MNLTFDNRFVRRLPADPDLANVPRQVARAAYTRVGPTPVRSPRTLAVADEVAESLGLTAGHTASQRFADVFGGNDLLPGMEPFAACYGGHQFGNWAGQLGDGRAITLGEVVAPTGRFELQLKGAGTTPYSRGGDGRAVLRSSVREFLCSEAMHHLGIPTTRALSLVATGDPVLRDMFYDGHPADEPGAVVCRVAPTFIRFGNFEIFAARNDPTSLGKLADFVLEAYFPHLGARTPASMLALFREVGERTLATVTAWMRVGFVHGVMNTDNMSILGLTIDYGPYGWLEPYDPAWTPNTTDEGRGRYRYGTQPQVALWNLARLAEALFPLIGDPAPLEASLQELHDGLRARDLAMMASKLGLATPDAALIDALREVLARAEVDWTLFFRALAEVPLDAGAPTSIPSSLADAWYQPLAEADRAAVLAWLAGYAARARLDGVDDASRCERMNAVNPLYVLRNWLAQEAIDRATQGDVSGIAELLDVLRHPYTPQPGRGSYAVRRPEWARHRAGCSMLSCSS